MAGAALTRAPPRAKATSTARGRSAVSRPDLARELRACRVACEALSADLRQFVEAVKDARRVPKVWTVER